MNRSLDGLVCRAGATDGRIAESERRLGFKFPAEYIKFLKHSNGGEGFIGGDAYLVLWPVEKLVEMNQSYEIEKDLPGLFIFGSDGAGEAYGFDMRTPKPSVVQVPFVGMDWDVALPVGGSFDVFLEQLSTSK
jgi:hypothetical protein